MSDLELLAAVELFEELEPEELGAISDASGVRILNRGDVLFTEGDEPNELFVVVSAASPWPTGRSTGASRCSR